MSIATISPLELAALCRSGEPLELIDVRTPAEFGELRVAVARNVPLDRLDPATVKESPGVAAGKPVYVICKSGGRGRQAAEKLAAAGVANVFNVEGGTLACEGAGLPIVRGKKMMSLERQVRIAAGSLVVLGCLGAMFVHPYLIGLAIFVGSGLVFAGVTDTCGMAMMLARAPWNQRSDAGARKV